ncbi:VWA domain-containing protein [Pontibacter sp. G13]|uniref:vWA domain-containing protein n=1 Tax=Pontibacter sp. G13 TaxID=3074898 RepID=UPI002889B0AD|nr:VWA domain-containing protein [Pontibacter sp. G13]WNJ16179.1 VWA domain-containing protein [Pontibacter sp. G13]
MFIDFFLTLRKHGLKPSLQEYLTLMQGLSEGVVGPSLDEFYYLSRSLLIKHESQWDLYDQVFGQYFHKRTPASKDFWAEVPEEWLKEELGKVISPEDLEAIEAMGGLDALIERFKELMEEQDERHEGGNRFIGTGGSSPYGAGGFNHEGFNMGDKSRYRNALKVWEKRKYANLNGDMELNTRNLKLVLKRLRLLTREGMPSELDLDQTIKKTSENAGMLDISMRPTRKNRVKVLLLFDIGGSMDDHVAICSQLFSAARYEFKHMESYYFHNCIYDYVWKDNKRRFSERLSTWDLLNTYNRDYKLIMVGDAAMSPYELTHAGGSVEHWNEEPGLIWLKRVWEYFSHAIWINPNAEYGWNYYPSTELIRNATQFRMYPMTLSGIQSGMKALRDARHSHGGPLDAQTYT